MPTFQSTSTVPSLNSAAVRPIPPTDFKLYLRTLIFGLAIFGFSYAYTWWLSIPNPLNKSVADTATLLISFSMLLSSVCYFFNFMDTKIIYRKHLGMIGFAFGLAHIGLSWGMFSGLFKVETWQRGAMWPALTAALATIIFTIMALISNRFMAGRLGGRWWRYILRTGYLALILIWFHVVLLKFPRWVTWFNDGMKTPPSMSLMIAVFIVIVVLMRLALWWSLARRPR